MGCGRSKEVDPVPDHFCSISGAPVFKHPIMMSKMMPMMRSMMNNKMGVGDNTVELTMEQVKSHEWDVWHSPGKDWNLYTKHRPYNLKDYVNKVPKAGDAAPDAPVLSMVPGSSPSTLLAEAKKLAAAKGTDVVAVLFFSMTCPVGRVYAWHDLYKAATKKGFPVLCVHTSEAHPYGEGGFHTGVNEAGPMALDKQVPDHKTEDERREAATGAAAVLSKQVGETVTVVLDGMDDALEKAYEARPFRMHLINVKTSTVALQGGVNPLNVPAKLKLIGEF